MICHLCGGTDIYIGARRFGPFLQAPLLCLSDDCLDISGHAVGYLHGIPFWPLRWSREV